MRLFAILAFLHLALVFPAHAAERRCGWVVNTTPGNWWLSDAQGEWILSTQGGASVAGMDQMPDLTTRDWISVNGPSYGYACICLNMVSKNGKVISISNIKQLKLKRCSSDRKLAPTN
jgi:Protein of unknown function (DUF4087)